VSNPARRQPLLALAVVIAVASTLFIANLHSRAGAAPAAHWVGSWAAALTPAAVDGPSAEGFADQTVRMVIHTSVGGEQARIRLSNVYGTRTLTVGHVTIGLPSGGGGLQPGSVREVLFNGRPSVLIPRGVEMLSDPVVMDVPAMATVAVSVWLPVPTGPATYHFIAKSTSYSGPGDHASDESATALKDPLPSWFYVAALDVLSREAQGTVAVLGDSISDGFGAKTNGNRRFPDDLAARLAVLPSSRHAPGVVNVSLTGNAYGHDGDAIKVPNAGDSALSRFDRDVVAQTGVRAVIVELGINDIWIYKDSPDAIITELRQLAVRAHEAGLRVLVCTLTPWKGYTAWTAALDATRLSVNDYIRSTKDLDGVVDADEALRDPNQPAQLRPEWDSGDHIHPNDGGLQALANAVPLDQLAG
jgi:lysophospholipase L1-like esterase